MEILLFIVLLLLSGFFSSTETAYFSLTDGQVRLMRDKRQRYANLVHRLKAHPQRLLVTILIGNNIVNLFTASYATVVAARYFDSAALGIATGLTTIFILIFGEIIPKSLAFTHNALLARIAALPLSTLAFLLYPVAWLLLHLDGWVNRLFRGERTAGVTEEEIRIMARMGVESGAIEYRERELIENVFSFDDKEVGDVMTPQYKVVVLNGMVPVDQIAYFVSQEGYSRYPVYDDNDTDDIIGYIHVNTIMRVLNSDERDSIIKDVMSPVAIVDESTKIERIFRSMTRDEHHLYMVHRANDPNEIIGIVTLEDILEELVGEIRDETDKDDHGKMDWLEV